MPFETPALSCTEPLLLYEINENNNPGYGCPEIARIDTNTQDLLVLAGELVGIP